jgi:hypothetical protein
VAGIPLAIAVDHPAFAGHFPGSPSFSRIVLDEAIPSSPQRPGSRHRIAWAKFLRPLALARR